MQDVQNYQYYDPSPGVTPVVWWKRKRVWQLTGLIVLALVVLGFVGVLAMNVLQNKQLADGGVDVMSQADGIAFVLESNCDEGDQACINRARADAARALGAAQACNKLSDQSFAVCVTLIAQDTFNPEVCKSLAGDDQQACFDKAFFALATKETKLDHCKKISSETSRSACLALITARAIVSNTCAQAGVDVSECQALDALRAAMLAGDQATCDALEEEQDRIDCTAAIWSVDDDNDDLVLADEVSRGLLDTVSDSDADGLTDGSEVHVHLTNPSLADTDADGYSDGTEIAGGFDPLQ